MKIVHLEPIGIEKESQKQLTREFNQKGHHMICHDDRPRSDQEKIERIRDAEIIVVSNLPLNREVLSNAPALKMISVAFAGVDHIDMEYCRANNILVSNAADYSTHSVAELTFGMILSVYRKIIWGDQQTRNLEGRQHFLGTELFGKTLGIIGLGKIGQQVAKIGLAFGLSVIAYNRSSKDIPGITLTSMESVLQKSDILSLHIPLTHETKGLIGQKEISLMKEEAILINTARGPVVNYTALASALTNKKVAGAALDVYEKEPPIEPDHPILQSPNTLLLPHLGFATQEAIQKRGRIVMENIRKWLEHKPQNVM
jgi:D-3-phosphoglycerate dehydrogenase